MKGSKADSQSKFHTPMGLTQTNFGNFSNQGNVNNSYNDLIRSDSANGRNQSNNLKSYISELKKVSTQNKKTRGQSSTKTSNGMTNGR